MSSNFKTIYYKPKKAMPATLLIIDNNGNLEVLPLKGSCTLGRQNPEIKNDIEFHSQIVGRRHGEFVYDDSDNTYYYIDNNSLNGTYINGYKLEKYNERGSKAYKLSDGDIIRIDRSNLGRPHPDAILMVFSTKFSPNETWYTYDLSSSNNITIGRDRQCTIVLQDFMASKVHAILSRSANGWILADNNSTNGVGVNGVQIKRMVQINDHDVITIANSTLIVWKDQLIFNFGKETQGTLCVEINKQTVDRGRKILLKDIKAEFEYGDFVLILGGSGAGKTTLIKAILGENRADGRILLDGQDLYRNFKKMKSEIGIVPQFLTLRENDTVRHTLMDTATIKLGKQYSKAELNNRVDDILNMVGIKEHEHKLIKQLSGGQQKKASVANQMVGFQKVFICDEPDSGLDGASRMQQMRILKDISLQKKIVMLISHEPDDATQEDLNGNQTTLFTKVIVLAKSLRDGAGHLAYFGDVENALSYFNVKRLQDIMVEINSKAEGGKGKADYYIDKYNKSIGGI